MPKFCRRVVASLVSASKGVLVVFNEDRVLALYRWGQEERLVWSARLDFGDVEGMAWAPHCRLFAIQRKCGALEVRDIEDGSLRHQLDGPFPGLRIRWLPLAAPRSLLALWSPAGRLRLLLDGRFEICDLQQELEGAELLDVAATHSASHLTLLLRRRDGAWEARVFATGLSPFALNKRLGEELERELSARAARASQDFVAALQLLYQEHAQLASDLAGSGPSLRGLLDQVVLLEDRAALAPFRSLYDVRKIYRLRDRLLGLYDEVRRRASAVADAEQVRGYVHELGEAQRLLVGWVIGCCGPASARLPDVRLAALLEAIDKLRPGPFYLQLRASAADAAEGQGRGLQRRGLSLTLTLAKTVAIDCCQSGVRIGTRGPDELLVLSWDSAGSLLSRSVLFDAEITTSLVFNAAAQPGALALRSARLSPDGSRVVVEGPDGAWLGVLDSKTLRPLARYPKDPADSWAVAEAACLAVLHGQRLLVMHGSP